MRLIDADELCREIIECRYTFRGTPEEVERHDIQCDNAVSWIDGAPAIDAKPITQAHWINDDSTEDGFTHHKCSRCNTYAPFSYRYSEDYDEDLDGEWVCLGITETGVDEYMGIYCHICGAKMDGDI